MVNFTIDVAEQNILDLVTSYINEKCNGRINTHLWEAILEGMEGDEKKLVDSLKQKLECLPLCLYVYLFDPNDPAVSIVDETVIPDGWYIIRTGVQKDFAVVEIRHGKLYMCLKKQHLLSKGSTYGWIINAILDDKLSDVGNDVAYKVVQMYNSLLSLSKTKVQFIEKSL